MTCYKCQSTENLSRKAYGKNTNPDIMICRVCRRNIQNERNKHVQLPKINKEWEARAKDSLSRISRKYKRVGV